MKAVQVTEYHEPPVLVDVPDAADRASARGHQAEPSGQLWTSGPLRILQSSAHRQRLVRRSDAFRARSFQHI